MARVTPTATAPLDSALPRVPPAPPADPAPAPVPSAPAPLGSTLRSLDMAIDALEAAMPDHRVDFLGPRSGRLHAVRQFLKVHQRLAGLHHLQDALQLGIERRLRIDERSVHCCLYRLGQPVAVVRLLPAPFEAGELHPGLGRLAADFGSHLDFARLVASPDDPDPRRVPLLLAHASRWAWLEGFDGTMALARAPQRRLYQRFGMGAVSETPCRLATRGDAAYWLLHGEWSEIARAADTVARAAGRAAIEPPHLPRAQPPAESRHA
jgi:hypothetical protein